MTEICVELQQNHLLLSSKRYWKDIYWTRWWFSDRDNQILNARRSPIHITLRNGKLKSPVEPHIVYNISQSPRLPRFCSGFWSTMAGGRKSLCVTLLRAWVESDKRFLIRQMRGVPPPHCLLFEPPNCHDFLFTVIMSLFSDWSALPVFQALTDLVREAPRDWDISSTNSPPLFLVTWL